MEPNLEHQEIELQEPLSPLVPYPTSLSRIPGITINHPGYPSHYHPLLYFPALDNNGIDYDLVYCACCILVGNDWPETDEAVQQGSERRYPYLTTSRDHTSLPIQRPNDGILRERRYYLFVPACKEAIYSTVIDFEDWVFPHGNLPAPWRSITTSPIPATTTMADELPYATRDVTISRDQSCRITQSRAGIEQAHIIPKAQENWFSSNDMSRYSYNEASAPAIHDIANTLLLRADVHHMLDQKELVIVPKRQRTLEGIRYHLVTHVLHARMRYLFEQQALYHNRKCQELYEIPIEFLFARFAWTIFNNFTIRLLETKNSPFYILIRSDSETDQSKMVTHYIRNLTDLRAISRGRWNVETTETSRKRTRDANDEEGLYYSYAKGRLVDIDQEPDWYQESGTELDDEEFERARKRERLNDENLPSLSQSVGSIGSSDEGIRDLDQDGMEKQELSVDNLGVKQPMPIRFQD